MQFSELTKKVVAYKQQMRGNAGIAKQAEGTRRDMHATGQINVESAIQAIESEDYPTFRHSIDVFEESISQRVARWIERYPQLQAMLGDRITVADVVEEVFLNAYDGFATRPHNVPPGRWLEGLIDPSVQTLIQSPDDEFDKISFSRSAVETSA